SRSRPFSRGAFCRFCATHGNDKVIECPTLMQSTIHVYEVRQRKDKRGVDLISVALPFGRLWYGETSGAANAIDYAKFYSRLHPSPYRSSNGKEPFVHNWRGIDYRI